MTFDHEPKDVASDGDDADDGRPGQGDRGWMERLRHLLPHSHQDPPADLSVLGSGAAGIRATKVSLIALGLTAAAQAMIVVISGSVALLSDTLHNLGDAVTAIPLWIAFALGRRRPTRTYTFGLQRAEDIAGLVIVLAIGVSGAFVGWESLQRLFEPRLLEHAGWVVAAGLIGALGNELVARYRIRVGRAIGSEALVADGIHARSDAWTSLAVVAAGVGAMLGAAWVDPIAGLLVSVVIFVLLGTSVRGIGRRLLDGVDPGLVAKAEEVILAADGVRELDDLRVRFHGHQLHVSASISVDPDLSLRQGHTIADAVEHELHHAFGLPVVATIHVDPHGLDDAHQQSAHHR
jgi:cation diffusion facilitator family transporter